MDLLNAVWTILDPLLPLIVTALFPVKARFAAGNVIWVKPLGAVIYLAILAFVEKNNSTTDKKEEVNSL